MGDEEREHEHDDDDRGAAGDNGAGEAADHVASEVGEDEAQGDEDGSAFERWRRDSALGAVGTGVARGLQSVFAPKQDEPAIVAEVPGDPPDADERIRVVLDPDDPTKSVVIVPERHEEEPPG
jgi:hypothetical protein